jgi:hypothetical protein
MTLYYAGIGSRDTPPDILQQMREFAYDAAMKGWVLRSGGADGADTGFEEGCDLVNGDKEIFVPWKGFNGRPRPDEFASPSENAYLLAEAIHPAYSKLRKGPRALIARNMHQIMGVDLATPVACVVCWTRDGCESMEKYSQNTGGTGSAIALADCNGIPIFNFKRKERIVDAFNFVNNLTVKKEHYAYVVHSGYSSAD